MKKLIVKSIRTLIIGVFAVVVFFLVKPDNDIQIDASEISNQKVQEAYELLSSTLDNEMNNYHDIVRDFTYGDKVYIGETKTNETIGYQEKTEYSVIVSEAGNYQIELDYLYDESAMMNSILKLKINGEYQFDESEFIDVPLKWKDITKEFGIDTYGDETLPLIEQVIGWNTLSMYNNLYYTDNPFLFYFEEGENKIEF